jgi:hypothetical protein
MCGWWSLSHYHRRFITSDSEPSALIYKYELDIASSITERRKNKSLINAITRQLYPPLHCVVFHTLSQQQSFLRIGEE